MIYKACDHSHKKVIIIGGGNSLKGFDFSQINDFNGVIITCNYVIDSIPQANYWITIDMGWKWEEKIINKHKNNCYYYAGIPDKYLNNYKNVNVHRLQRVEYFTDNKNEICGGNSGLAMLNLAYHFNAEKILMLGIDGYPHGQTHFYHDGVLRKTNDKMQCQINNIPCLFEKAEKCIHNKKIEIYNASKISTIKCFNKITIKDGISWIIK